MLRVLALIVGPIVTGVVAFQFLGDVQLALALAAMTGVSSFIADRQSSKPPPEG